MEQEGPYWVYILQNPQGRFYVGQTPNLEKRLREHNTPVSGEMTWPHKQGPWQLVWKEPHATHGQAVKREQQIKRMKSARWIRAHLLGGAGGC
jgi:predicted GIY-YIG superfamily endonuclease